MLIFSIKNTHQSPYPAGSTVATAGRERAFSPSGGSEFTFVHALRRSGHPRLDLRARARCRQVLSGSWAAKKPLAPADWCYDTACTISVATCCDTHAVATACLPLCAKHSGRGGRNIVLRKPYKGRSKRQIYRKGYWVVAGLHTSAAGRGRAVTIFRFCHRGRDPASCHGGLLEHRSPTQLEEST